MLRGMTGPELLDWLHYATVEPFGMWWQTMLAARALQFDANMNRDMKKHPEAYELEEFVLRIVDDRPFRTQTWQQQKAAAKMIVTMWNLQEAQKEARKKQRQRGA